MVVKSTKYLLNQNERFNLYLNVSSLCASLLSCSGVTLSLGRTKSAGSQLLLIKAYGNEIN